MVLKLGSTPAITAVVILSIGLMFGFLSTLQNVYHWHFETSRAQEGLPVYDVSVNSKSHGHRLQKNGQNLNTLV